MAMLHYPTIKDYCVVWLHDYLTENGETSAGTMHKEAANNGFKLGTLRAATYALGNIVTQKLPGQGSGNTWRISGKGDVQELQRIRDAIARVSEVEKR